MDGGKQPIGEAELRMILNESFSFGSMSARVEYLVKQAEERKQDEVLWRARLEPLLAERSGDREKIERIRGDLNGLGDKVRKMNESIERIEKDHNTQVLRIEERHAKERSDDLLAVERIRGDMKRYLAFVAGAIFAMQAAWALFGDAARNAVGLGQ